METNNAKLFRSIVDFAVLAGLIAAAMGMIYLDAVFIGKGVPEGSFTEISAETILLASVFLFWNEARCQPKSRGFFILVGGFFACLFVREMDFAFDRIDRGFWLIPCGLVFAGTIAAAAKCRDSILSGMAAYADSRSCIYISIGLLTIFIFSRFFGSGRWLWAPVMGKDGYTAVYKSIIQEGTELYGYTFIFFGAWVARRDRPSGKELRR